MPRDRPLWAGFGAGGGGAAGGLALDARVTGALAAAFGGAPGSTQESVGLALAHFGALGKATLVLGAVGAGGRAGDATGAGAFTAGAFAVGALAAGALTAGAHESAAEHTTSASQA